MPKMLRTPFRRAQGPGRGAPLRPAALTVAIVLGGVAAALLVPAWS